MSPTLIIDGLALLKWLVLTGLGFKIFDWFGERFCVLMLVGWADGRIHGLEVMAICGVFFLLTLRRMDMDSCAINEVHGYTYLPM